MAGVKPPERLKAVVLLGLLLHLPMAAGADNPEPKADVECVVLLHGLGRTSQSMDKMAKALATVGYATANLDYASREHPIEKLALDVIPQGLQRCRAQGAFRIHFVTHSLGGILVRYYLSRKSVQGLGRVVMLSPPNQGSEVADALQDTVFYQWYTGPAGQQLGTGPGSLVIRLGPVHYPVGVITGNTHAFFDARLADLIPGPNDGKVSVEHAKVEGMADFLALPYAHPFIMEEREVVVQTIHFLRYGRFEHAAGPSNDGTD